ncbi:hypothetical protein RI367_007512 [Sorochytrium milnesiophthora]
MAGCASSITVANVNVSDVLEEDNFSDKPYHSSGSGHSSDTDGSYAPRIGNAGYLAAMTVPPPASTQTLLSPRKRPRSQGPTTQPRGDNHAVPTAIAVPLVDGKKLTVEALLDSGATDDLMD